MRNRHKYKSDLRGRLNIYMGCNSPLYTKLLDGWISEYTIARIFKARITQIKADYSKSGQRLIKCLTSPGRSIDRFH